jgi:hypothetical protein
MTEPWVPDRGPADPSPHTCLYGTNPNPGCGAPGTWHIAWDKTRQSISCDRHMAVAQTRWLYLDRHPLSPDCGMPNATWLPERCAVPGEPALAVARAILGQPDPCSGCRYVPCNKCTQPDGSSR